MKTRLILLIFLGVCVSARAIDTVPLRNGKKAVPAAAIFSGYAENEIAMDAAIKGKTIFVYGTVEEVAKDIRGRAYVLLSAGESMSGVQCFFRDNSLQLLAAIRQGQTVYFSGKVLGKMGNVLLDDCMVESPL